MLKHEPDPTKRQAIIDAAYDIAEKTDDVQDGLLNPGTFGSPEDDTKLADWISETSTENYRKTIKEKFTAKGLSDFDSRQRPILASGTVPGWSNGMNTSGASQPSAAQPSPTLPPVAQERLSLGRPLP